MKKADLNVSFENYVMRY